ncbi:MAG: DUF4280 domain-containing protein [Lachnospiraceae bacterium]|nr:DUF4280 domain-containing protein [Lachnospiraceae bacterium]
MSERKDIANGKQVTLEGKNDISANKEEKILSQAKEQHDLRLQEIFKQLEVEDGSTIQFPYLVRGAELWCSCGTHKRKLNLPLCHGIYIGGRPIVHEEDCGVGEDKNICAFGICQSEENPANFSFLEKVGENIKSFFTGEKKEVEEQEEIILQLEDGTNVKGYACRPRIIGTWKDVYKEEKIARNGTNGLKEEDRLSALTWRSFLVCAYGGLIEPITSGQEEE